MDGVNLDIDKIKRLITKYVNISDITINDLYNDYLDEYCEIKYKYDIIKDNEKLMVYLMLKDINNSIHIKNAKITNMKAEIIASSFDILYKEELSKYSSKVITGVIL